MIIINNPSKSKEKKGNFRKTNGQKNDITRQGNNFFLL